LGDGSLNGYVSELAVSGRALYVGGWFTNVKNGVTTLGEADYITKWDGMNWSALGSDGVGNGSLNSLVLALAVSGSDLYVGGFFTDVNNGGTTLTAADYVAKYQFSAPATSTPTPTQTPTATATHTPTSTATGIPTFTPTTTATLCVAKPSKPTLGAPKNAKTVKKPKVLLDWDNVNCADSYRVLARLGSKKGTKIINAKNLPTSQYKTGALTRGQTYYWRASACNALGCTKSAWQSFKIKP